MAKQQPPSFEDVPPFYKYTECRVEGHSWATKEGWPRRTPEGGIEIRSVCSGCLSERVRYFDHRGRYRSDRSFMVYPKDYLIRGGMPRARFVVQHAREHGLHV